MNSTEKDDFMDDKSRLSIEMNPYDDGIESITFDGKMLVCSDNYAGHSWLEIDQEVWDTLKKELDNR